MQILTYLKKCNSKPTHTTDSIDIENLLILLYFTNSKICGLINDPDHKRSKAIKKFLSLGPS
jgi:hypothetical protein